jgi:hypothetical protein
LESWYASTKSADQAILPAEEPVRTPSASRAILLYVLLVVMPAGLIVALLVSNWAAGGTAADTGHAPLPGLTPLARVLAALAVIICAARLAGYLAQRLGQPAVIGEIAGGILLGPSVLQAFWPAIGQTLLAPEVTQGCSPCLWSWHWCRRR